MTLSFLLHLVSKNMMCMKKPTNIPDDKAYCKVQKTYKLYKIPTHFQTSDFLQAKPL